MFINVSNTQEYETLANNTSFPTDELLDHYYDTGLFDGDKPVFRHWDAAHVRAYVRRKTAKDWNIAKKVEANDDKKAKQEANNGDPQMEALQELMKMSVRRQLERSVDLQEQMRSRGITLDFNVDAGGLTLDFKRDAKKK